MVKIELEPLSLIDNVRFDSKLFWLTAEEKKEIPFYFHSHDPKSIKGLITVVVRGGKVFKIPLSANFVYP